MMEERSRDIASIDNATGDGEDLSKKRQRTDEHPGLPTIPVTANAAATPNHQHHQHAVSGAPSSNVGVVVVKTRGEGGAGQQPPPPPPPIINNDHSSSSFHNRISLSPPGTLPPPPPTTATARAAAAAAATSSSDMQQLAPTITTTTSATSRMVSMVLSTGGTSSNNSINSSIHSVPVLGNKNSQVASCDSRRHGVVAVVQQQALPDRRHFRSKLLRVVVKRCYILVALVAVALVGGVYTMQQQQQQHEETILAKTAQRLVGLMQLNNNIAYNNNIPPTQPPAFWPPPRWLMSLLQKSTQQEQQQSAKSPIMPPLRQTPVVTLRDFLSHHDGFSLAMAPAFFGFYGYFGALAAWEDSISTSLLRGHDDPSAGSSSRRLLQHVSGASAGAMAAVLLAAGVAPKRAAEFCETITLSKFADFPGVGAIFRGYKFERIMHDFLWSEIQKQQQQVLLSQDNMNTTNSNTTTTRVVVVDESLLLLQNARVPVAVTALDIETMQTKILTRGSMARAARASATFPFLFQPVGWVDDDDVNDGKSCNATDIMYKNQKLDATLIDGGIRDHAGVEGLKAFVEMEDDDNHCNNPHHGGRRRLYIPPPRRIVQLAVGGFLFDNPPEPGYISTSVDQVVSISLNNLPMCGPWPSGLRNGPIAVQAAYRAMMAALDTPLEYRQASSQQENDDNDKNDDKSISVHYELQLDTTPFWKSS